MIDLPKTEFGLFIRTDFSNQSEWENICEQIKYNDFHLPPMVTIVDDFKFSNLQIEDLPKFGVNQDQHTFLFLIDKECIETSDHYILCVDISDEFGRSFRTIPSQVFGIEANLGLANMDFFSFADGVDADGVFRSFK